MKKDLPIMLLWHLHQPLYRSPGDSKFKLPWVRKHTLREYHDMAAVIESRPEIPVTVNWTPVLLQQIEEYVKGTNDQQQIWRDQRAEDLNPEQRYEFLAGAFKAHPPTIIHPYPRFKKLKKKWHEHDTGSSFEDIVKSWEIQEIRDIQVWDTLGWFGFSATERYQEIKELREKGEDFTEGDKKILQEIETELLNNCLPRWKSIHKETPVEFSTTPYFHPIGPLITNYEDIDEAMPGVPRPERPIKWPEDAHWHLETAREMMTDWLGTDVNPGLWPSEGSLSEAFMEMISNTGFPWVATDEALLRRQLETDSDDPRSINKPYLWHGTIPVFFRNHELSDRIGFEYSRMPTEEALDDFFSTVEHIDGHTRGESDRILSIILDGENPWEYFSDAGESFLKGLYDRLLDKNNLEPVTPDKFLSEDHTLPRLEKMSAGSWINGDFNIWGGHSLDVRAWELLAETREALRGWDDLSDEVEADCWRALYAAEGSDWFWWYGEPFQSADDEIFDQLFREFLISIYRMGNHPEPSYLHHPLQSSEAPSYNPPRTFVQPSIDGRESHYREWWGAADISPGQERGAMARASERFECIRFGSNEENLFGRIDFINSPPDEAECRIQLNDRKFIIGTLQHNQGKLKSFNSSANELSGSLWSYEKILEWKLPMCHVDISPGEYCRLTVELARDDEVFDRFPFGDSLRIPVLDRKQAASEWTL